MLIDAMPVGETPGTVVTFDPDVESIDATRMDAHSTMIHWLIYSLLLALLATLVVKSLPDIARYLKIRDM